MRGRWAAGIEPRNFAWILKDQLAVSERPGGFAPHHRRVRRQEEILWLNAHGFTRVVSLLPSNHNLHAYDELHIPSAHFALPLHGDARPVLADLYGSLWRWLHDGERVLLHQDELGEQVAGVVAGFLCWSRLLPEPPRAVSAVEQLLRRQMGHAGRSIVAVAAEMPSGQLPRRSTPAGAEGPGAAPATPSRPGLAAPGPSRPDAPPAASASPSRPNAPLPASREPSAAVATTHAAGTPMAGEGPAVPRTAEHDVADPAPGRASAPKASPAKAVPHAGPPAKAGATKAASDGQPPANMPPEKAKAKAATTKASGKKAAAAKAPAVKTPAAKTSAAKTPAAKAPAAKRPAAKDPAAKAGGKKVAAGKTAPAAPASAKAAPGGAAGSTRRR